MPTCTPRRWRRHWTSTRASGPVALIGLPHEDLGSAPHALVELAEDVSDYELIAWVRERIAPYKVPHSIERMAEPLRDDAGKVRRSQLRAARADDHDTPTPRSGTRMLPPGQSPVREDH
ncbi:MAG: hypothetical protein M3137_20020 [Actinomycetota bacterium]|nr:hypothetical protein [Actinomycetota bacterium]